MRIVVNGQSQEPYSVRIWNASHLLLTVRANQHCAWPAFVELLLWSAGTLCHIPSPLCLRVEAGVCFAIVMVSFEELNIGGVMRVYALSTARSEQSQWQY
jgi:hypothetical protein